MLRHHSRSFGTRLSVLFVLLTLNESAFGSSPLVEQARTAAKGQDFAGAAKLALQAVRELDTPSGRTNPDLAEAELALGTYQERLLDLTGAEKNYRAALATFSAALGADHPNVAGAAAALASVLEQRGAVAEALPLRQRALTIVEATFGASHALTGTLLHNLGRAQLLNGDRQTARATLERAFSVRDRANGSNHPDVAQTLAALASVYSKLGDLPKAEQRARAALVIFQNTSRPDPDAIGNAFESLGSVAFERGDLSQAADFMRQAMTVYNTAHRGEGRQVGMAVNNLAEIFTAMGNYREAEDGYSAALGILTRALGAEHPDVALVRSNLAELLYRKGDLVAAESIAKSAVQSLERAYGKLHPDLMKPLAVFAKIASAKGESASAEALLLRVADIVHRAAPDGAEEAATLTSLAAHYARRGDERKAVESNRRALATYERLFGKNHPHIASVLTSLGTASAHAGNHREAKALFTRALELDRRFLGDEHPDVAASYLNLAGVTATLGEIDDTVRFLDAASQNREQYLGVMLSRGAERDRRAVYASVYTETQYAFSLHLENAPSDPRLGRIAYETLLRRKGRLLDQMAGDVALSRSTADPATKGLFDALSTARSQLSNSLLAGQPDQKHEGELRGAIVGYERQLAEHSERFRAMAAPVKMADVALALPKGTALVEYVKYRPFNLVATKDAEDWAPPRYAAYVLTPDQKLAFVKLGAADKIDAAVEVLRKKIQAAGRPDPRAEARVADALIFQPVREKLGAAREIFVSTDGKLSLLPFAALVDEHGSYAVERFLVQFVGSGRDLLRFRATPPRSSASLVLANPAYDLEAPPSADLTGSHERSLSLSEDLFQPLPGTDLEGQAVAKALGDARLMSGAAASVAELGKAHGPRVLHIATHGFFVSKHPGIQVPTQAGFLRSVLTTVDDPFVRSGLALAGANSRAHKDDGLLSAYEAASLDLVGTRLVVLSACETGLGEVVDGIEVQGLGRAFAIAGAESLVMSLWKVDDQATRELMAGYYARLAKGGGRAEALREVQRDFLTSSTHATPYYWAAFSLTGDPRSLGGERVRADVDSTGHSVQRVAPGARGCGCSVPGLSERYAWIAVSISILLSIMRRRRRPCC